MSEYLSFVMADIPPKKGSHIVTLSQH